MLRCLTPDIDQVRLAYQLLVPCKGIPEEAQDLTRPPSAQRGSCADDTLHPMISQEARYAVRGERIDMLPGMEDASAVGAYRFENVEILVMRGRCNQKAPRPENTPDVP